MIWLSVGTCFMASCCSACSSNRNRSISSRDTIFQRSGVEFLGIDKLPQTGYATDWMLHMCEGAAGSYGLCKREGGEKHHCFASSSRVSAKTNCFARPYQLVWVSGRRRATAVDRNCGTHGMINFTLPICLEGDVGMRTSTSI